MGLTCQWWRKCQDTVGRELLRSRCNVPSPLGLEYACNSNSNDCDDYNIVME